MKYIIGTGWWCSEEDNKTVKDASGAVVKMGKNEFHRLWVDSIERSTNPDRIVMVDSCSPVKPEHFVDGIETVYIKLNENSGHVTNMTGDFCGWSKSVLMSMEYASHCDCDFYVYVEQDALLKGKDIIEHCIAQMPESQDYMFGSDAQRPQPLQQSFFIVRKRAINKFLLRFRKISLGDDKIAPEVRFALITSPLFPIIPKFLFIKNRSTLGKVARRIQSNLSEWLGRYKKLPMGHGRERPINFDESYYYFQHGSVEELETYLRTCND